MSLGLASPNYVRSVTFNNTADAEVTLAVTFASGHTENYTVAAGATQNVERDYEVGTSTQVDPVTGFSATHNGATANADWAAANGVEVRTYNIGANGVATQA